MTPAPCRETGCTRRALPHSPWCDAHFQAIVEALFGRSGRYPVREKGVAA